MPTPWQEEPISAFLQSKKELHQEIIVSGTMNDSSNLNGFIFYNIKDQVFSNHQHAVPLIF